MTYRACVDTGFNGALAIPQGPAATLGLVCVGDVTVETAMGERVAVEVHSGSLSWLGGTREVLAVTTANPQILVGMELSMGTRLEMEASSGYLRIVTVDV